MKVLESGRVHIQDAMARGTGEVRGFVGAHGRAEKLGSVGVGFHLRENLRGQAIH